MPMQKTKINKIHELVKPTFLIKIKLVKINKISLIKSN